MSVESQAQTGNLKTAVEHAMGLLAKGQSEQAKEQADEILRHYPDEVNSLLVVSAAIRAQGNNEEALERLWALVGRVPDFALALFSGEKRLSVLFSVTESVPSSATRPNGGIPKNEEKFMT